jgi:hypothetical protein
MKPKFSLILTLTYIVPKLDLIVFFQNLISFCNCTQYFHNLKKADFLDFLSKLPIFFTPIRPENLAERWQHCVPPGGSPADR